VVKGPLLIRHPEPAPKLDCIAGIPNFYAGHPTANELEAKRAAESHVAPDDIEKGASTSVEATGDGADSDITPLLSVHAHQSSSTLTHQPSTPKKQPPPDSRYTPAVTFYWLKHAALHDVEQDVVVQQNHKDFLSGDLDKVHATGEQL
jgi:sodium-dependent phosphate transporter